MGVTALLSNLVGADDPARWDNDPAYRAALDQVAAAEAQLAADIADLRPAETALAAAQRRAADVAVSVRLGDTPRASLDAAERDLVAATGRAERARSAARDAETIRRQFRIRAEQAETAARQRVYRQLAGAHARDVAALAGHLAAAAEICDRMGRRMVSINNHFDSTFELGPARRAINSFRPDPSLPFLRALAWPDLTPDAPRYLDWLKTARDAGYRV